MQAHRTRYKVANSRTVAVEAVEEPQIQHPNERRLQSVDVSSRQAAFGGEPVYTSVDQYAASGAYYTAVPSDRIS